VKKNLKELERRARKRAAQMPPMKGALLELMLHSARLATRHDIMRFAERHDLDILVHNKDNRERAIKKLLNQILGTRPDRQNRMIKEIAEENGRQTEGWVNVIRRSRN
jgi:hypothetical protein